MEKEVKIKRISIILGALLVIGIIFFAIFISTRLGLFHINSFSIYNIEDQIIMRVRFDKSRYASSYEVTILNSKKETLFKDETTNTYYDIPDLGLNIDEEIYIQVQAKGSHGRNRYATPNYYEARYKEPILKVADVTSDRASGDVEGKKKIVLKTATQDSKIYYTIDGSEPDVNSMLYEEPISITKTMTIKAIAVKANYEKSDVAVFSYNVKSLNPVIYLSPSTQIENYGVASVGYTTEYEMMNKVGDVVEKGLKEAGITVYRNVGKNDFKESIQDSRKYDPDFHIAIHSNAAPTRYKGRLRGIETYVYDGTSIIAREMAYYIQNALVNIYYDEDGNRGIRNSVDIGGLAETNPDYVNNGILIEVAFHDNKNDAKWIVQNIDEIGQAIIDAILNYYENWG